MWQPVKLGKKPMLIKRQTVTYWLSLSWFPHPTRCKGMRNKMIIAESFSEESSFS